MRGSLPRERWRRDRRCLAGNLPRSGLAASRQGLPHAGGSVRDDRRRVLAMERWWRYRLTSRPMTGLSDFRGSQYFKAADLFFFNYPATTESIEAETMRNGD